MYVTKFCSFESLVEKRSAANELIICGYASVYNQIDAVKDVIEPGAFQESVGVFLESNAMPFMFREHDKNSKVDGEWILIRNDSYGLYVEGRIYCPKLIESISSGSLNGLSVGFYIQKSSKLKGVNYISKGKLVEVSLVKNPANPVAKFYPKNTRVEYQNNWSLY